MQCKLFYFQYCKTNHHWGHLFYIRVFLYVPWTWIKWPSKQKKVGKNVFYCCISQAGIKQVIIRLWQEPQLRVPTPREVNLKQNVDTIKILENLKNCHILNKFSWPKLQKNPFLWENVNVLSCCLIFFTLRWLKGWRNSAGALAILDWLPLPSHHRRKDDGWLPCRDTKQSSGRSRHLF